MSYDYDYRLKTAGMPTVIPIPMLGRLRVKPDRKVWAYLWKEAQKNKQWAENHEYAENPDAWPASMMSISMLKGRLQATAQGMAEDAYAYFYARSHQNTRAYGGYPLDPSDRRKWEKITGEPILPEEIFGPGGKAVASRVNRRTQ